MSENLNEAVALLNDSLALSRSTTSVVDQVRLDASVQTVAVAALEEVEIFLRQLEADRQAAVDAAIEAEAQNERTRIEEEERAAQALVQDAEDQAQREERHAAGVS